MTVEDRHAARYRNNDRQREAHRERRQQLKTYLQRKGKDRLAVRRAERCMTVKDRQATRQRDKKTERDKQLKTARDSQREGKERERDKLRG